MNWLNSESQRNTRRRWWWRRRRRRRQHRTTADRRNKIQFEWHATIDLNTFLISIWTFHFVDRYVFSCWWKIKLHIFCVNPMIGLNQRLLTQKTITETHGCRFFLFSLDHFECILVVFCCCFRFIPVQLTHTAARNNRIKFHLSRSAHPWIILPKISFSPIGRPRS